MPCAFLSKPTQIRYNLYPQSQKQIGIAQHCGMFNNKVPKPYVTQIKQSFLFFGKIIQVAFKLYFEDNIHQTKKKSQKKGYKDGMCKGP